MAAVYVSLILTAIFTISKN